MKTKVENTDGEPVVCTTPIREFEPMEFLCPWDGGKLTYLMEPLD
jgi:hypothetical protein